MQTGETFIIAARTFCHSNSYT